MQWDITVRILSLDSYSSGIGRHEHEEDVNAEDTPHKAVDVLVEVGILLRSGHLRILHHAVQHLGQYLELATEMDQRRMNLQYLRIWRPR